VVSERAFTDSDEFKRGREGEQSVEQWLRARGDYVIRSYDYSGEDGDKAPRMHGLAERYALPDLDVCREGEDGEPSRRWWVEVKAKHHAIEYRKLGRLEHGISLPLWMDYLQVQAISGCEVWIVIVEEETDEWLAQSLKVLGEVAREYDGDKMGPGGMVFFPRDAFIILTR